MNREIFSTKDGIYRIIEIEDTIIDMKNLKGDMFNLKHAAEMQPGKSKAEIIQQEKEFESFVNRHGVFGYALEKWDATPGVGWDQLDSCWGFIGQYSEAEQVFNHYIVDELKSQIKGV